MSVIVELVDKCESVQRLRRMAPTQSKHPRDPTSQFDTQVVHFDLQNKQVEVMYSATL